MVGSLHGKTALVTGGASGIGRATALAFAREGASVVVADLNVEGGEETVRLLQEADGDALFVQVDVSQAPDIQTMIATVVETYGRLDIAFNNAGVDSAGAGGELSSLDETDEAVWARIIAVNLTGVWLCMKYELQHMLQNGGGAIVNTASVAGLVGAQGLGAYAASKHGVVGLTKTAALENARRGVRVNAVCPGFIDTPMVGRTVEQHPKFGARMPKMMPAGRIGQPEEVAEAVVWLCSDAASFITGAALPIDGAFTAQ